METAANLADSFKIVLILLAALSSFFSSVVAFILGIFVHFARSLQKRSDELMTISHTVSLVLIPILFLTVGVVFHTFISILFKFAYDVDFSSLTAQFLSFNSSTIEVPATVMKIKDKLYYLIATAIPFLKAFALNSLAAVYVLIPIFYIANAVKILEIPKLLTSTHANTSIFAVVFYAVINIVIGLIISQFYASIVNQIFFFHSPTIDNLGEISSVADYTTAKLKEWIQLGFNSGSSSGLLF